MTMTLRAYDAMTGREVRPGDTIRCLTAGQEYIFRAALRATEAGRDGRIQIDAEPGREYYLAGLFGLSVSLMAEPGEPAWESAGTDEPRDIQRDIRGPGGFWALVGPGSDFSWDWSIIDSSDGETVAGGDVDTQGDGKQAVLDWEREHGLIPGTAPSGQPEPAPTTLDAALTMADHNRTELIRVHDSGAEDDSSERDAYTGALENLADAVREYLAPDQERTAAMAAEADRAARTTAPPVPGVTQNTGHTVYAVIRVNHVPGEPSDDAWIVAAANDRGEHVTWKAYASDDSSGRLHYDSGHYHSSGEGAKAEALADLADRAGVFTGLTGLSSGTVTREVFQASHEQVLTELSGTWGVGRARVRSGLLEAAALGYARISWHERARRQDYGIRYDRVRCTFTWNHEH